MKKTLILLLACCACIRSQAQTPEAAAAPEPSTIAGALDACCPLSAIVNPLLLCACMPTSERNR